MLSGRTTEIQCLEEYYGREGSQILVVYGQKNIGKTTLLKEFMNGKPSSYYMARSCSEQEQLFQWSREIDNAEHGEVAYDELFSSLLPDSERKKVIVIDEFQYLVKANNTFLLEASSFFKAHADSRALLILCSSSVGWVENSMIRKLGEAAFSLSGLLKIKNLHFLDMQKIFFDFSQQQCLETYAILGGVPGLWAQFESSISVKENIIRHLLPEGSFLASEADRLLYAELRETNVYNTILACLASGMYKLNDLHKHTGFSRAKISVYLKNLMELEIVEKAGDRAGIYRIGNQYMNFYYTFMYPNMSYLEMYTPIRFFESFIAGQFNQYVAAYWERFYSNGPVNSRKQQEN